mmetsp:Transcript_16939/g.40401  ORF Transcript_16939/g.40401 Transcript_16939/m.40401 type:complete len:231 (+) Transcript_16939:95-787(+)
MVVFVLRFPAKLVCCILLAWTCHFPLARVEETLAIVKPDANHRAAEVILDCLRRGFSVVEIREMRLTASEASNFYKIHRERAFFGELIGFMSSGELTAMILESDEAVERWRKAIGPTDAAAARETAPESLRAKYGTDKTRNALHGSDSRESAALEIAQLFPNRTAAARGDDRGGGAVAAAMTERLARLPRADALAELSLLASALGREIAEAVQAAAAAHDRAPRSDRSEL